jgi:hypothetical protein
MKLFASRTRAIAELQTTFSEESAVIEEAFSLLETCITQLATHFNTSTIARAASLAAAKGTMLGQGCFSLILDGLGQESGALLRPLVEVAEFLTYLHNDDRAEREFREDKLPSPGNIAERINGQLKFLRDYLNKDASHLNFSFNSLRHMIEPGNPVVINSHPRFHAASFRENLRILTTFLMFVLTAAVVCLTKTNGSSLESEPLAVDVARFVNKARLVFQISV